MFEADTAVTIASAIDRVQTLDPELTGPLSLIDEAVSRWAAVYPQLAEACQRFSDARHNMWPGRRTDESVREMRAAAASLAEQMRLLGQARIALCQAQTGFGVHHEPLLVDGSCPMPHVHI